MSTTVRDMLCEEFAYVLFLIEQLEQYSSEEQLTYEEVRDLLRDRLEKKRQLAEERGLGQPYQKAQRALVPWIDERLTKIDWPGREQWKKCPLQYLLYGRRDL